jgi:hypothetical protein
MKTRKSSSICKSKSVKNEKKPKPMAVENVVIDYFFSH